MKMDKEEIFKKLKKVIVDQLSCDEDKVTLDASFTDTLGADSLDIVELLMTFEEEFNVEIPDEAAEKLTTVGKALDYIQKKFDEE